MTQRLCWSQTVMGVLALAISALTLAQHDAAPTAGGGHVLSGAPRAALTVLQSQPQRERSTRLRSFAAGSRILIRATPLPRPAQTFCVGLASLLDRGGLPITLGRLHAAGPRTGTLLARIPAGLIGPEPPGPYLVFVGDCTVPAPMGDYGSTLIAISR